MAKKREQLLIYAALAPFCLSHMLFHFVFFSFSLALKSQTLQLCLYTLMVSVIKLMMQANWNHWPDCHPDRLDRDVGRPTCRSRTASTADPGSSKSTVASEKSSQLFDWADVLVHLQLVWLKERKEDDLHSFVNNFLSPLEFWEKQFLPKKREKVLWGHKLPLFELQTVPICATPFAC